MKKKVLWITETAVMLAALIALQTITKPLGQIVTGSAVNTVLAITALVAGLSSGITVALLSPVFAYLLGIAPQLVTVPAIMVGNTLFVVVLWLLQKKLCCLPGRILSVIAAAAVKFAALYTLVVWVVCGVAADALIANGLLKAPMLTNLPVMFAWPQLITALVGGTLAALIAPILRKVLHRKV